PTRADEAGGTAVKFYELRDNLDGHGSTGTPASRKASTIAVFVTRNAQNTVPSPGPAVRKRKPPLKPKSVSTCWMSLSKISMDGRSGLLNHRGAIRTPCGLSSRIAS